MLRKFLLLLIGFGITTLGYAQGLNAYVATVKNYYPASTVTLRGVFPSYSGYYCGKYPPSTVTDTTPQTFVYGGSCSGSNKQSNQLQPYVTYQFNLPNYPGILTCTFTYSWDGNQGCNVALVSSGKTNLATCTYTATYSSANNTCNYSFIFKPLGK